MEVSAEFSGPPNTTSSWDGLPHLCLRKIFSYITDVKERLEVVDLVCRRWRSASEVEPIRASSNLRLQYFSDDPICGVRLDHDPLRSYVKLRLPTVGNTDGVPYNQQELSEDDAWKLERVVRRVGAHLRCVYVGGCLPFEDVYGFATAFLCLPPPSLHTILSRYCPKVSLLSLRRAFLIPAFLSRLSAASDNFNANLKHICFHEICHPNQGESWADFVSHLPQNLESVCISENNELVEEIGLGLKASNRRLDSAYVYLDQEKELPPFGRFHSLLEQTEQFHVCLDVVHLVTAAVQFPSIFSSPTISSLHIDFQHGTVAATGLQDLFQGLSGMRGLETLRLAGHSQMMNCAGFRRLCAEIGQLPHLRRLHFRNFLSQVHCSAWTDSIPFLAGLQDFSLTNCYNFRPEHFVVFLKNNPELEHLELFNCRSIPPRLIMDSRLWRNLISIKVAMVRGRFNCELFRAAAEWELSPRLQYLHIAGVIPTPLLMDKLAARFHSVTLDKNSTKYVLRCPPVDTLTCRSSVWTCEQFPTGRCWNLCIKCGQYVFDKDS